MDIIKEETIASRKDKPYKKAEIKEAGSIKKITNDKKLYPLTSQKNKI